MTAEVTVVAHLAGVPVEELLLPLAPAGGVLWLAVMVGVRSWVGWLRPTHRTQRRPPSV